VKIFSTDTKFVIIALEDATDLAAQG